MDASVTLRVPSYCRIKHQWWGKFSVRTNGLETVDYKATSNTNTLVFHKEPVNIIGYGTRGLFYPPDLECESNETNIVVGWSSYDNAQKWWDGSTPNYRTVTSEGVLIYNAKGTTVTISLNPDVIYLKGPVGSLVETQVMVRIKSDGPVRLSAPEVTGVQYEHLSNWEDVLDVIISDVSEQGRPVSVRLGVTGGKTGDNTYRIPFTVNVI